MALSPYSLEHEGTALVDVPLGRSWSYPELAAEADALASRLDTGRKELAFCLCGLDARSVIDYLAAVRAGHAVTLIDQALDPHLLEVLVETYRPRFVLMGGELSERQDVPGDPVFDELTLLLSTSGTTGSPKLVRLSRRNVDANAASITKYLEVGPGERGVASLPLHYCYGLSVLHTHLAVGGSIVFTGQSAMRAGFWEAFAEHGCTSFAGVPFSFELLRRTGFERRELPTLRTMTQAGGRMDAATTRRFHEHLSDRGARLFVMYGQTEATARISYVPPDRLEEKLGSIGVPIPDVRLEVRDGELVCRGPNVMLGYATSRGDLARGDELGGELRTGDLGRRDEDGFFWITGRAKRFTKIYGLRINLDEVEASARDQGPVAAVGRDDGQVTLFVEEGHRRDPREVRQALAATYGLTPKTFEVRVVGALPVTASGKVDYGALEQAL